MTKFTIAAVILAIATSATAVTAQSADPVQSQINALAAQGYTSITVKRSQNRTKIEARNANGQEAEVVVRNADGAVLSTQGDGAQARAQEREPHRDEHQGNDNGSENDSDHGSSAQGSDDSGNDHGSEHGSDDSNDHGSETDHGSDDGNDGDHGGEDD